MQFATKSHNPVYSRKIKTRGAITLFQKNGEIPMNTKNIFTLLSFALIINITTSFITSSYVLRNGIEERSLKEKQPENVSQFSEEAFNHLIQNVSELQQQVSERPQAVLLAPKENDISTPSLDLKLKKLTTELTKIKQQIKTLSRTTTESIAKLSLSNSEFLPTDKQATLQKKSITLEEHQVMIKKEVEEIESNYETVFYNGGDDISWTTNIEDKVGNLITANKLGENTQLQDVECRSKLCKIYLSHKKGEFDEFALLDLLGDVSVYVKNKEGGVSGQQETIMYISREGENLPEPARFN